MRQQRWRRNLVYRCSKWINIGSATTSGLIGLLLYAQPDEWKWFPFLSNAMVYIQHQAWWMVMTLGVAIIATQAIMKSIGSPIVWSAIADILEDLRDHAFDDDGLANNPTHHNRITLFKWVRCRFRVSPKRSRIWVWGRSRFPFSGWLVPVFRTGHTTQRTDIVFLAPDDADSVEGVVGECWAKKSIVFVDGLPDLNENPKKSDLKSYADSTSVDTDFLRKRLEQGRKLARSFAGIPIEVGGRPWGILVLDSRNPQGIKEPNENEENYTFVASILGHLLRSERI